MANAPEDSNVICYYYFYGVAENQRFIWSVLYFAHQFA